MKNSVTPVGIVGIGAFLPEAVRRNDWWPSHVVESWKEDALKKAARERPEPDTLSESARLVFEAMADYANDPFQGAVERRILDPQYPSSYMEIRAAEEAIKTANMVPSDIDALLSFSFIPDYLATPNSCLLHRELGLPEKCFTMSTESACNAFLLQLGLAQQLIAGGMAKNVLLVQSNAVGRVIPQETPFSAWFGDGATAAVASQVGEGYGILGQSHRTDGTLHDALVIGVPGKRWYEDGPLVAYAHNRRNTLTMLLRLPEFGDTVLQDISEDTGLSRDEIDFYACHQPNPWFRRVTQEYMGLRKAVSIDTFPWAGSLSAANIPLVLATAHKEGTLKNGDLVAMYSGGSGVTFSGNVSRWCM